ncbi:Cdc6/Cdc18 family protein [Halorarius litoreus]|uniref:Cdc6/Cdc18 family protein n=1 Tax=Halorarius litoreus TaxID=2962676 RepID=UPI0020CF51F7|nr:AAA family ATPase [Halorarius litoreus]
MDLADRIRRRQRTADETPVVIDYDAISPVTHLDEPVGRGPLLERLLDHLDPAFAGRLPPNGYLHGPGGAGKSAVVTALFDHLARLVGPTSPAILTTTRAQPRSAPVFVYVDARHATSQFALVRAVLDGVVEEPVPNDGVGTDRLRQRLDDALSSPSSRAVVAVDHVGESGTPSLERVSEALDFEALAWLAIGRTAPESLGVLPPERFAVGRYERSALLDVLTERASAGIARDALDREQLRRTVRWAEGDAHDGLAALFGAADQAAVAGHGRIHDRALDAGMEAVPRPSVPLGRVMALPRRRQAVLRALVDLDGVESIADASDAIAREVDLSASTVKRFCYELAEVGVVERVPGESRGGAGRPPSRLEPRFPTRVFRRLYDSEP